LDFAVKGSCCLFLRDFRRQRWIVIFISTCWFLNVVLPVVIGSYFVLNFKTLSLQPSQSRGRRNYIK
jgi:hypothetical protein